MATARDIAIRLCVTLIVAAGVSWPAAPAHAGASCNLGDLFNSAVNAVGSFGSSACLGATADDGGAVASYAIAGGLEAVAAANSGAVNDFCNALNTAQDNLNSLQTALNGLNARVDLASVLGRPRSPEHRQCALQHPAGHQQLRQRVGGLRL